MFSGWHNLRGNQIDKRISEILELLSRDIDYSEIKEESLSSENCISLAKELKAIYIYRKAMLHVGGSAQELFMKEFEKVKYFDENKPWISYKKFEKRNKKN